MTLLEVFFLLLSLSPPSISSNKCCEKVKITLGYEAELLHNKTTGTYVANKISFAQNDNKTNYKKGSPRFKAKFLSQNKPNYTTKLYFERVSKISRQDAH